MHTDHTRPTESTTEDTLVVLDADDPETTLQAVIQETDPATGTVDLLAVYPTAEYEERRRARIDAGVTAPYTIEHLADEARKIAEEVGREYLGPDAARGEAMGAVGGTRACIRRAVRDADYSQVFVPEEAHAVWQRLLGVESLSTELTRVLPDVVSVRTVEDVTTLSTAGTGTEPVFASGAEGPPES